MFHRVDDYTQLDSPRFYRLAERLVHYDGAVRHALAAELERRSAAPLPGPRAAAAPISEGPPLPAGAVVVDPETMARMAEEGSGGMNFPSIEIKR